MNLTAASSTRLNDLPPAERRSEPRLEARGQASIRSLEMAGAPLIPSRVLSTSENGLQLQTAFIFPRQLVQIRLQDRTVSGEVRYCKAVENEFRIGVCLGDPGEQDAARTRSRSHAQWAFRCRSAYKAFLRFRRFAF